MKISNFSILYKPICKIGNVPSGMTYAAYRSESELSAEPGSALTRQLYKKPVCIIDNRFSVFIRLRFVSE